MKTRLAKTTALLIALACMSCTITTRTDPDGTVTTTQSTDPQVVAAIANTAETYRDYRLSQINPDK